MENLVFLLALPAPCWWALANAKGLTLIRFGITLALGIFRGLFHSSSYHHHDCHVVHHNYHGRQHRYLTIYTIKGQCLLVCWFVCLILIGGRTVGPWGAKFGMGAALNLGTVMTKVAGPNGPFRRGLPCGGSPQTQCCFFSSTAVLCPSRPGNTILCK